MNPLEQALTYALECIEAQKNYVAALEAELAEADAERAAQRNMIATLLFREDLQVTLIAALQEDLNDLTCCP